MIAARYASIALALFLTGCATSTPEMSIEASMAVDDAEIAEAPATRPETPIPDDSLLPLLQAEFALRQRDFNQGLALLAEQAVLLEDPALARRALRLAEFVNDTDQAAMMAVRLVELDPGDGAAAAAASGWLSRAGRPVDAVYYAQLAFEHGHPVNVATNLGTYDALDEGSQVAITETIRAIAAQWPEDDQAAIAVCLLARIEGDLKGAESFILPVLERSPEDVRAVMLWTQLMLDQDADDPFELLATTVSRYPDNQELRLQYARLLGSEGNYAGAQAQFVLLLERDPENTELLSTAALLDFELEYFDEALSKFQQLIALGERLDEAHYYIGRIEMANDRYPKAIAAFASVGPSREFRDAKALAAQLLIDTAFASDIKTFFVDQRRAYPSAAEQLFLLEADSLRDWSGESLKAYDRGLTAFPQSFSLLYGRAMVHESEGQLGAMEDDLRSILAQDPDHTATLNALGYTLTNHTQRYEEAADLIERALALSPGDPAILDSLGWVYYKLGQYSESEALLREAHNAFPDPEVAAHLGEVLWVRGRQIEARDVWRAGLSRVPDHPIILEAVERLGAELP
ncbi:MAG: tetratricopeptide repeat protein [Luminiphilus sp.]|nr:tetratricopeptide repeat protein [Luminiphilus sp.]